MSIDKTAQESIKDMAEDLYKFAFRCDALARMLRDLAIANTASRFPEPVDTIGLLKRTSSALLSNGITTLGELLTKTDCDLLSLRRFGETSYADVVRVLSDRGLSLKA